jgi:metal transporter CNNM
MHTSRGTFSDTPQLITYNPEDEWPVQKFPLLPLPEAKPDINCFQALDYFQTGRAHLLLISNTPGQKGGAIGIVSCEFKLWR